MCIRDRSTVSAEGKKSTKVPDLEKDDETDVTNFPSNFGETKTKKFKPLSLPGQSGYSPAMSSLTPSSSTTNAMKAVPASNHLKAGGADPKNENLNVDLLDLIDFTSAQTVTNAAAVNKTKTQEEDDDFFSDFQRGPTPQISTAVSKPVEKRFNEVDLLQCQNLTILTICIQNSCSLYEYLFDHQSCYCLLYTSPSPRDGLLSRMPSSA
eukprot:TRINITY_DN6766_c0_g1_i4.p1 TRINITY_DN6766_c0_g1~~TRINITY_DN6766_c0_g1_i4.p1  ORF type:complete len:209 (-),score=31.78 TRINITY_DN6766_c0_g1_i4:105-731(-)